MNVFLTKGVIIGLVVLFFSVSVNASPLSSKKLPVKSQMEQFMEVYKILMGVKSVKSAKPVTPKTKLLKIKTPKPAILKTSFSSLSPSKRSKLYTKRLRVTATAYTSHVGQTDSTPNIAAWGDRLRPGMKAIAVSRDLLKVYGLKHKQKVRIKGLKGEYVVLDKMHKRWRKKIDIYMGRDKRKAFRWGRRKVEIQWN